MKRIAALSTGVGLILIALLLFSPKKSLPAGDQSLTVYCSEALKKPIESAVTAFSSECGIEVDPTSLNGEADNSTKQRP